MKQKSITKTSQPVKNDEGKKLTFQLAFGPVNYILMVVGIVILAIGYILLSGGGSDDPNTFNPAMFDSRRLTVAPILIVLGFAVEIFAIMFKGKKEE
jgi:amino acid permease